MKTINDIKYNSFDQLLDINLPENKAKAVFVYFHGGGLEVGSKDSSNPFIKVLTDNQIAVVDVNYRMYPTAHCPDFINDAADAVAWTFKNIKNYVDCDKIFVGGSSAGGYLSQMLCFDKKYLGACGLKPTDIAGYIHDAGQPTTHFNVLREMGVDTRRVIVNEYASLYHMGANGNDCSPMIFIVSDEDMENRFEQTMLALSTLKHFRYDQSKIFHKVMNGTHCHYLGTFDENNINDFGRISLEFIEGVIAL